MVIFQGFANRKLPSSTIRRMIKAMATKDLPSATPIKHKWKDDQWLFPPQRVELATIKVV
jgi:hypothetical protein